MQERVAYVRVLTGRGDASIILARTGGSGRGGEGAEGLGGLAGEIGEAQEDLKGEES